MGIFRKAKPIIENSAIERLISGADEYIKRYCSENSEKPSSVNVIHGQFSMAEDFGPQYSEDDVDEYSFDSGLSSIRRPKPQYSARDTDLSYSLRDTDRYDSLTFSKSMRSFINGNSNLSAEAIFKNQVNNSFSSALVKLIDKKCMRDSAVYKAAGIDRRLFSKIVSNRDYKPSKNTCIALALALKLDLEDVNDLLERAGYTLSHSIKRDLVIEYCIREKEYSLAYVNELLYRLGMDTLRES